MHGNKRVARLSLASAPCLCSQHFYFWKTPINDRIATTKNSVYLITWRLTAIIMPVLTDQCFVMISENHSIFGKRGDTEQIAVSGDCPLCPTPRTPVCHHSQVPGSARCRSADTSCTTCIPINTTAPWCFCVTPAAQNKSLPVSITSHLKEKL